MADNTDQYKHEVALATKAKQALEFMRDYFETGESELFTNFGELDMYDTEAMQYHVMAYKMLREPENWLNSIIDTGRLAQMQLDKDK